MMNETPEQLIADLLSELDGAVRSLRMGIVQLDGLEPNIAAAAASPDGAAPTIDTIRLTLYNANLLLASVKGNALHLRHAIAAADLPPAA